VAATESVLKAEFPNWHVFASFDVFNLKGVSGKLKHRSDDVSKSLSKLALAFKVSKTKFQEQYSKMLPVAAAVQKQGGLTNRNAWQEALQRMQQACRSKNQFNALQSAPWQRVGF
jgi:hypothetical protein